MADAAESIPSRRLPLGVIIVVLAVGLLSGVFSLLWFKLPDWNPRWVIKHSPWADPIVRSVSSGSSSEVVSDAAVAIVRLGRDATPRMLSAIGGDPTDQKLAAYFFAHFQDKRSIQPIVERVMALHTAKTGAAAVLESPMHHWAIPLGNQDPQSVVACLLPYFRTGAEVPWPFFVVAGRIDDERMVEALVPLLKQPWNDGDLEIDRVITEPTFLAAGALANSPCQSGITVLEAAYGDSAASMRLRAVYGIVISTGGVGRYRGKEWHPRLKVLLARALTDSDIRIRRVAADVMSEHEIPGVEAQLIEMTRSTDPGERRSAINGLAAEWYGDQARHRLVECLRDPDPEVCVAAITVVSNFREEVPIGELLNLLDAPDDRIRGAACLDLVHKEAANDPRVFSTLIKLIDDPVITVAEKAFKSAYAFAFSPERAEAINEAGRRLDQRSKRGPSTKVAP